MSTAASSGTKYGPHMKGPLMNVTTMHPKAFVLCLDFGGSAVKHAIASKTGALVEKGAFPTPNTLDGMLEQIASLAAGAQRRYDIEGIAISACGAVDPTTGIIGGCSAIPYIHGPNWTELIRERCGLPCEIENDANAAALSELWFGEARTVSNMVFLVIGSGVGGTLVINRQVVRGAHGYGGEFGCELVGMCGGRMSNFSEIASTGALVRGVSGRIPNRAWNGVEVFAAAEAGDETCTKAIEAFFRALAHGVYNIQHSIDPEMILFGGGISAREDFIGRLSNAYRTLVDSLDCPYITPVLATCTFKQDANLIGALAHYLARRGEMA